MPEALGCLDHEGWALHLKLAPPAGRGHLEGAGRRRARAARAEVAAAAIEIRPRGGAGRAEVAGGALLTGRAICGDEGASRTNRAREQRAVEGHGPVLERSIAGIAVNSHRRPVQNGRSSGRNVASLSSHAALSDMQAHE